MAAELRLTQRQQSFPKLTQATAYREDLLRRLSVQLLVEAECQQHQQTKQSLHLQSMYDLFLRLMICAKVNLF